jgi:hypothetical protein
MTPFELNLRNVLDVERQRFTNKWLFPWHNINIQNGVVDVEDFRGGKFAVGGILFQGDLQQRYWQAIDRYLVGKVHETFQKWNEETGSYQASNRQSSIEGTVVLLRGFVSAIIERATKTDRRLRGRGFPDKVTVYNASGERSHANAEISRLADSHRSLISSAPNDQRGGAYVSDRAPTHERSQRGRRKSQPARESARAAINELYPNGVPGQAVKRNANLCREVGEKLKQAGQPGVSDDTILRAASRRKYRK